MATDEYHNSLEDGDLETDYVDCIRDTSDGIERMNENLQPPFKGKANIVGRDSERNDSGFISGGLSDCDKLGSIPIVDKAPVQCSDVSSYVSDDVSSVEEKLAGLTVNDEDEAISMTSVGSLASETTSIVAQESAQDHDIYVDLTEQDEDGDTVLHNAIVNLLLDIVLVLIDLCDDVECLNIQNNLRQTPLHLAVLTDQPEIVQALIAKGADVTLRDQQGNTPLHIACRLGNRDAVSAIVKSLPDLNARQKYFSVKNNEGLTCMHIAVQAKEYIILGHLLAKGADVNIGDAKSGRSMLHYAVERKDLESVSLLLTHKDIDVDRRTFKGETPIVLAFWRNYQDIVKKLKANGAYFDYSIVEDSDDEYTS